MANRWSTADIPDQRGRVAIVTGANSGLGFEIAGALARAGAAVLLACRNVKKAEDAAAQIIATTTAGSVEVLPLDLSDLASVTDAAQTFRASDRPLHLLINNAGLMAVDRSRTADGFETQLGVNHLGHFALTADLLPSLLATPSSRVVNMASMGHRAGRMHFDDLMFNKRYDRWRPYFQSKLANLLFTSELHRRLERSGHSTVALAAHPGVSHTNLGTDGKGLSNTFMRSVGSIVPRVPFMLQTAAKGSEPALRAATAADVAGGEFYGPRWLTVGHAVREKPSRRARSTADAERLWQISEQLTGRSFP